MTISSITGYYISSCSSSMPSGERAPFGAQSNNRVTLTLTSTNGEIREVGVRIRDPEELENKGDKTIIINDLTLSKTSFYKQMRKASLSRAQIKKAIKIYESREGYVNLLKHYLSKGVTKGQLNIIKGHLDKVLQKNEEQTDEEKFIMATEPFISLNLDISLGAKTYPGLDRDLLRCALVSKESPLSYLGELVHEVLHNSTRKPVDQPPQDPS